MKNSFQSEKKTNFNTHIERNHLQKRKKKNRKKDPEKFS